MQPKLEKILIEQQKQKEKNFLNPQACFSFESRGRMESIKDDFRSPFMRDRDRIIHSSAFRRLKDKAQVFLLSHNDMIRTRLTHTLEVSQVARTIAVALSLNETLTEAIALGHDLGHTPFGHIGERALKVVCADWFKDSGKDFSEVDFLNTGRLWTKQPLKGFRHNIQSLRLVDFLANKGEGLNLTYEVRDGILNHSKWGGGILSSEPKFLPITLEGQVVRISDRIAYVNHDLQDALRSKSITLEDIPKDYLNILGRTHSERIGKAVISVIDHYQEYKEIGMDKNIAQTIDSLYSFLGDKLYRNQEMNIEAEKATFLIKELAEYYLNHPEVIEERTKDIAYPKDTLLQQKIVDYIANMTDHFILREFKRCCIPKNWAGL